MIHIELYESSYRIIWNDFVRSSKNGTFLLDRGYMEYHADRFKDHSLLFFDDRHLVAILPANLVHDTLISHGGLTYGGLITDKKMTMPLMMGIFDKLQSYSLELGILRLIYKSIPHIYHRLPAEEDAYALFVYQAHLYRRDVSSTIDRLNMLPFTKGRRGCIKKAYANGIVVQKSNDFEMFMQIDEQHLISKHNKKPVHTAAEIKLLSERFPENIQLFGAYREGMMLGGIILYVSDNVAHAQYIAATVEGKLLSALDAILDYLINDRFHSKRYFDFGISTDQNGRLLDSNLIANKESFGARATVYDFYEWSFKS
jgi:hypothetical protein